MSQHIRKIVIAGAYVALAVQDMVSAETVLSVGVKGLLIAALAMPLLGFTGVLSGADAAGLTAVGLTAACLWAGLVYQPWFSHETALAGMAITAVLDAAYGPVRRFTRRCTTHRSTRGTVPA